MCQFCNYAHLYEAYLKTAYFRWKSVVYCLPVVSWSWDTRMKLIFDIHLYVGVRHYSQTILHWITSALVHVSAQ